MKVLEVLYREVVYRRMKDNPRSAGKISLGLGSSGDLKKTLLFQTAMYALFGLMLFPSLKGERDAVLVMASTYAILPFILAFYATVTNSSYIASLDLFKPLLPLPIRLGGRYMSVLLLLESLPAMAFMLPGAVRIGMAVSVASGLLVLLWSAVGLMLGHVFGLLVYYSFGKTSSGRFADLKSLAKALGVILIFGLFYGFRYFQDYVLHNYASIRESLGGYEFIYPLSVLSVDRPSFSAPLAGIYISILGVAYYVLISRLWVRISEGSYTSGRTRRAGGLRVYPPELALMVKDFKTALRNTPVLTGLLVPIVIPIINVAGIFSNPDIGAFGGRLATITFVAALGWVSAVSVETLTKIEVKSFELLLSLPLERGRFLRGKLLTMAAIPSAVGVLALLGLSLKGFSSPIYLPMTVLVPLATCGTALQVYYHGTEGLALPQGGILKSLAVLILNAVVVGIIAGSWYLSYPIALLLTAAIDALLLWSLSR